MKPQNNQSSARTITALVTRYSLLIATLLLAVACASPFYGLKSDPEALKQVKKLALVAYTVALPVEGSGGYGLVRVGAMDTGNMQQHAQAIITDAAERLDNELQDKLKDQYIPLDTVRKDDFYKVLVKKETGNIATARDTVDLIRSSNEVDLPTTQKLAAKLGVDAVIMVHNTIRFYKATGWYATIEPALIRVYAADGKLLLDGKRRFTSTRWDIDRSSELDLSEEQHLLAGPVESMAQWLIKALSGAA